MANEKEPRSTTARRPPTTTTTPRAPRTTKAKLAEAIAPATTSAMEAAALPEVPMSIARNAPGINPENTKATLDADAVRRRAYELYEQRGCLDGYHEQDWFTAEQELSGRKLSQNSDRTKGRNAGAKRNDSQRSA